MRYGPLLFLLAGTLWAQPGSISSMPTPASGPAVLGPAVFDAAGNLYFFAAGPVTAGAVQTQNGGGTCLTSNGFFDFAGPCSDAYAAKVDASGNLVFGTYLGGATADQSTALAADAAGNVYVTGSTGGSFPTTAGSAIAASTTAKAFAAKLSSDGSHVLYATYLPGTVATTSAIAVDTQGSAYVAGTSSTGHAFVLKLSPDGSKILYNVTLGGTLQDAADAIAADAAGNVIAAGHTNSADFPVSAGAVQSHLKGAQNIFVARLDANGGIVFSTYLGGSGTDTPAAVRIDSAGNVYLAGRTTSLDFPTTAGSFEPAPVIALWNNAGPGGFAAKLKADGTALAWSTYVMSADSDPQRGVTQLVVSASGETYIAGLAGAGFPVTASAPQTCFDGTNHSVFVAHLDSRGALADATYAGKNGFAVQGLTLSADGSIVVASTTDAAANLKSQIRLGGAGWSAPSCISPSVLNSATMSVSSAVVPGEVITLTGYGIGPDIGIASQADAQGQIPRQLAGVQVLFDGQPAPVLYAQSRQINALAPVELNGHSETSISVVFNQATIGTTTAKVSTYGAPGIFRLHPGASAQAAALNADGTINGAAYPAARGSTIAVWGTGFGLIDPPCATGGLNPPGAVNLAAGLGVLIADGSQPGVPQQYAAAQYAGSAPTLPCGVEQINLLVPTYVPAGVYQFFPWSTMNLAQGGTSVAVGTVGVTIFVK